MRTPPALPVYAWLDAALAATATKHNEALAAFSAELAAIEQERHDLPAAALGAAKAPTIRQMLDRHIDRQFSAATTCRRLAEDGLAVLGQLERATAVSREQLAPTIEPAIEAAAKRLWEVGVRPAGYTQVPEQDGWRLLMEAARDTEPVRELRFKLDQLGQAAGDLQNLRREIEVAGEAAAQATADLVDSLLPA